MEPLPLVLQFFKYVQFSGGKIERGLERERERGNKNEKKRKKEIEREKARERERERHTIPNHFNPQNTSCLAPLRALNNENLFHPTHMEH